MVCFTSNQALETSMGASHWPSFVAGLSNMPNFSGNAPNAAPATDSVYQCSRVPLEVHLTTLLASHAKQRPAGSFDVHISTD